MCLLWDFSCTSRPSGRCGRCICTLVEAVYQLELAFLLTLAENDRVFQAVLLDVSDQLTVILPGGVLDIGAGQGLDVGEGYETEIRGLFHFSGLRGIHRLLILAWLGGGGGCRLILALRLILGWTVRWCLGRLRPLFLTGRLVRDSCRLFIRGSLACGGRLRLRWGNRGLRRLRGLLIRDSLADGGRLWFERGLRGFGFWWGRLRGRPERPDQGIALGIWHDSSSFGLNLHQFDVDFAGLSLRVGRRLRGLGARLCLCGPVQRLKQAAQ